MFLFNNNKLNIINIIVKILVKIVLERMVSISVNLKYSKLKRTKWCVKVIIAIKLNNFKKSSFIILNTGKSISDFLVKALIIGNLKYATHTVAAAFTPPESKKKSLLRPNKKLKINNKPLSRLTGKIITNKIYKSWLIYPKKLILFRMMT